MHLMSRWQKPQKWRTPATLWPWLTNTGSLTRRLQHYNKNGFSVDLLANSWIRALPDECRRLNIDFNALCYQREVRLLNGDSANVYARTIVPMATYQSMKHRFNHLGNQSLGEWLFTDPTVERGAIEVTALSRGQWLYEMAVLSEPVRPERLWARRSVFYIETRPLLVNEIFLSKMELAEA